MALSLAELSWSRPYLYHLTARENLPRIRATRRLESASALFEAAGESPRLRERRREHVAVSVEGVDVLIRSGSPRYSGGKPSPRGPDTFVPCERFPWTASRVVEVVFEDGVALPPRVDVSDDWRGPWRPLWAGGG